MERIETVIVGGGQAGLSTSYYLAQNKREHVVLEKADRAGNAWRNGRWDSFVLVTPNWSFRLPGAEYQGDDPGGFMPRDEVVACFEKYVDQFRLPVQFGVQVTTISARGKGYQVETHTGGWIADNVVLATGLYQKPKKVSINGRLPSDILEISSDQYRSESLLPEGAVLVAGSAQSGCQIAEELYQAGRVVYLCTGSGGRVPRRYRGRDIFDWLHPAGFFDRTVDKLASPQARFAGNPHLSGKNGGHGLNLHQFHRDGVRLLGRLEDIRDGKLNLALNLKENLAKADAFEANVLQMVDRYIEENHIEAPKEQPPCLRDAWDSPEILELDLKKAGIKTIIWAIGFTFDFSLVKLPVLDSFGFPVTAENCDTRHPGLFFAGMPWLPNFGTGVLLGVGKNAQKVAERILARKK